MIVTDLLTGLFASLMDRDESALNVFDVWLTLFPEKKDKINKVWSQVKPCTGIIREYRNNVVCHINKNLSQYMRVQFRYSTRVDETGQTIKVFAGLAAELMRAENRSLPGLRAEIDPILRAAIGKLESAAQDVDIERVKDTFLEGG
jgi:hypothetical protein